MGSTPPLTVFITGGASGTGEGLARAFHAKGAKVIIGGRDAAALARVAGSCPGMETSVVDVTDAASVARCAADVTTRFPDLDMLVNNAGVQRILSFAGTSPLPDADLSLEVDTNETGLARVTNAFLPHLKGRSAARLVHVGSGLAYVPLCAASLYSASKAAVHAFTIALRRQLAGTRVKVIELVPPAVKTNLHRGQGREPPGAMELDAFVAKAIEGLSSDKDEIHLGLANVLRAGSRIAPSFFLGMLNKPRS
jgi:uncharacterized oxidoreductase